MLIFEAFDLKSRRHTIRPRRVMLTIHPLTNLHATKLTASIPERLTVDICRNRDETVTMRKINRNRLPFRVKMLIAIPY
jgi:hypothetical protein